MSVATIAPSASVNSVIQNSGVELLLQSEEGKKAAAQLAKCVQKAPITECFQKVMSTFSKKTEEDPLPPTEINFNVSLNLFLNHTTLEFDISQPDVTAAIGLENSSITTVATIIAGLGGVLFGVLAVVLCGKLPHRTPTPINADYSPV